MSKPDQPRQPRAFAVPEPQAAKPKSESKAKTSAPRKPRAVAAAQIKMAEQDYFETEAAADMQPIEPPAPVTKSRLGGAIAALFAILFSLAIGLWTESLITTLFDRNTWLGWAALGVTGVLALLLVFALGREIAAIWALRSITALRTQAEKALETKDPTQLRQAASALAAHYVRDPRTAAGRAALAAQHGEIIDAQDLYAMAETDLLKGLDAQARDMVMASARRVSVVTAVSPRALVDIAYVLYENVRLIRAIAVHYGGRTGFWGTFSLARRVVGHLAVTGSVAIGDSLIQQLVGHGVAARLSARLGEGVINGLMTVRVGLSAIDVCRPAPFNALPQPKIREFINVLTKFATQQEPGKPNQDP